MRSGEDPTKLNWDNPNSDNFVAHSPTPPSPQLSTSQPEGPSGSNHHINPYLQPSPEEGSNDDSVRGGTPPATSSGSIKDEPETVIEIVNSPLVADSVHKPSRTESEKSSKETGLSSASKRHIIEQMEVRGFPNKSRKYEANATIVRDPSSADDEDTGTDTEESSESQPEESKKSASGRRSSSSSERTRTSSLKSKSSKSGSDTTVDSGPNSVSDENTNVLI